MKKYEAYKNSSIEWIGEIPEGWEIVPLKHYLSLKGRIGWNGLKSEEFQKQSYAYLVTGQDFNSDVVNWDKCYQINKERYDEDPFIQLENGDLLVTKDGTIGKVAKVVNLDKPACLNSGIFVVKQTKGVFEQNYLYWILASNQLKEFVGFNSTGSTIAHLYQNVFENMPLTVPPLSEQQAIASYLDHKVGQIDASVSAINTQIDDLKAYRQSIISEAVTKGLNPNAKMKDSGIEWIGEIPEGWETMILKRVAKVLTGTTPNTADEKYWENPNYTWYTPSDIKDDSIRLDESDRKVNFFAVEDGAIKEFPAGSILMVGIGTIGKVGIADRPCSANQQINAIVFNSLVNPKYGAYFLFASRDNIRSKANAALLPIINQTIMGNVEFVLPTMDIQNSIVDFLDNKTSKIDASIVALEAQRDDLNALKQSIISEAVTGKIDLRDWKLKK